MTSYVNANSNVIKSYAKKQEKRKEKKSYYQMKIIDSRNHYNNSKDANIPIACSGVHQSNFDSFLINKSLSIKVYQ